MLRSICILLAVASSLSTAGYGQGSGRPSSDEASTIRGRMIFSSAGELERRVEVQIQRNFQVVAQTYTDSIGHFEFRNLQPGNYQLVVELSGYETLSQPVDLTRSSGGSANVTVVMNRRLETITEKKAPGFEGEDPNIIDARVLAADYPSKAVKEYEKAIEESEKGNVRKAIGHLQEAVQLAPDFFHAFNNLGVAFQQIELYREAEDAYLRAIEISPNAQQPVLNLAVVRMKHAELSRSEDMTLSVSQLKDAVGLLQKAISIRPRTPAAHYYLGAAYYQLDMFDQATPALLRALELDAAFASAHLMLSNVYMKLGKWDLVLERIDAYLREQPGAADALQETRAKVLQRLRSPME